MKKPMMNVPITRDTEEHCMVVNRSALNHWFRREEKPAKRQTWPVVYEPPSPRENPPCPPGIDQSYWQNLSKIEQIWTTGAGRGSSEAERRELWQYVNTPKEKEKKEASSAKTDYLSEALRPADPFEEPIPRKTKLLESTVNANAVPSQSTSSVWRLVTTTNTIQDKIAS